MSARTRRNAVYPFLLLELVISLGLLALLLGALFSFLLQAATMERRLAVAREALLARHTLHLRLDEMFSALVPYGFYERTPASLYTLQKGNAHGLCTIFDQGIDPDPLFSGIIRGKLYLDEQNLILLTAPLETVPDKKMPYRKEILSRHVARYTMQFFSPHAKREESSSPVWHDTWSADQNQLPFMIRLYLWDATDALLDAFVFFIPAAQPILHQEI